MNRDIIAQKSKGLLHEKFGWNDGKISRQKTRQMVE